METPQTNASEISEILARDDAAALATLFADGLDPRTWLDLDDETSLLALAVRGDRLACATVLLERGGDWASAAPFDEEFEPPLALALRVGGAEMVALFLRHGAVEAYPAGWLAVAVEAALDRDADDAGREMLERVGARFATHPSLLDPALAERAARFVARRAKRVRGREGLAARWRTIGAGQERTDLRSLVADLRCGRVTLETGPRGSAPMPFVLAPRPRGTARQPRSAQRAACPLSRGWHPAAVRRAVAGSAAPRDPRRRRCG